MPPSTFPPCPHRPACGGCPLRDLSHEESLREKTRRVAEAFARFPDLVDAPVEPCAAGPAVSGYRTRVKLAVGHDPAGGPAAIGLFAAGTHQVVDVPGCDVVYPGLHPVLDSLRDLLRDPSLGVRHVDLRWSRPEGRAHVTLVAEEHAPEEPLHEVARRLMEQRAEVSGAGLRRAGGPVGGALYGETRPLEGRHELHETLAGKRFHLSPGTFFQADPGAAEDLHRRVRDWLAPAKVLVDLYAGVGAFAVSLADSATRAVAVESVPAMAEDARRSAALSGVAVEVEASSAERFAARLRSLRPDRVVLDPPRRGVAATVLQALGATAPGRLACAACDPETAARDAGFLAPYDLRLRAVIPMDLFAATGEVECLLLLEHAPGSWKPTILEQGRDWLVVRKPPLLPVHPEAEGGPNLRDLVRRATGLGDLQPAHRLDAGTSGPLLLARGEALAALGRSFESRDVAKEYLALVRGVPRARGRITGGPSEPGEESRYHREDVVGGYGLVRVMPLTGRHHQVRRHLARIKHPILGDGRYGDPRANRFMAEVAALQRPFLHLHRLAFPAPGGRAVTVEDPPAPDLVLALDRLVRHRERL